MSTIFIVSCRVIHENFWVVFLELQLFQYLLVEANFLTRWQHLQSIHQHKITVFTLACLSIITVGFICAGPGSRGLDPIPAQLTLVTPAQVSSLSQGQHIEIKAHIHHSEFRVDYEPYVGEHASFTKA